MGSWYSNMIFPFLIRTHLHAQIYANLNCYMYRDYFCSVLVDYVNFVDHAIIRILENILQSWNHIVETCTVDTAEIYHRFDLRKI